VPFIIRWPGVIPAGRRLDTLFSTVDITPTLLGLAGEAVLPQMQGADLSAILKGKDAPGPESAFIMSGPGATEGEEEEGGNGTEKGKGQDKRAAKKGGGKWRGLRTPRYTYAKAQEGNGLKPWLLYDNEKDPHQMDNLVEDPAHADTRKELDAKLHAWLKRVGEA
jgi:arylsulfatase A-like enzyme